MSMLAVMTVATLSVCFMSCGDDDDGPEISIVGTWTFDYGDEGYCSLTFSGTATSGTVTIVDYEKGHTDTETSRYTYKDGYLYLPDIEDYEDIGAIKVISLTETKLVLCDFPDDGNCTFTKGKATQPTPSLVGTWKYTFSSGYVLLTFSKNGTGLYQEYDHGRWEEEGENFTWTYSGNILTFKNGSYDTETARVVSLTSTKLVLKDWPDSGNCTFYKQ